MADKQEILKNIASYSQFRTEKRLSRLRETLEKRQPDLSIVLENINDPHNLSAALRSCESVGIMRAHLVYYGRQPFPKLSKTSSASAMKWVETVRHGSVKSCYDKLKNDGFAVYATRMDKESVSLYDLDLTKPVALVFGNEHDGVSEEAYSLADENFLIPQAGMIQSLNISVACAVSLYEAFRQRLDAGFYDSPRLSDGEIEKLINEWSKI